jgi:glycosyltransferase involved in cell wall biosynthesis
MSGLPPRVVHYGRFDPHQHMGGVETFARNLGLVFEEVLTMHPGHRDQALVEREHLPVICDNHTVLDWPEHIPLIGFRHGVAALKANQTRSLSDYLTGRRQKRAAGRPNTYWVACAEWIARASRVAYDGETHRVIYHAVDLKKFDGLQANRDPRLILHDARTQHKGQKLIAELARRFDQFRFEPLACKPEDVPDRMRRAAAFLHLSRYEGNSVVCMEAMAMNLPCLFTRVGLMLDQGGPSEVFSISPEDAFGRKDDLFRAFEAFAATLETRVYRPRDWVQTNASPARSAAAWQLAMEEFQQWCTWRSR